MSIHIDLSTSIQYIHIYIYCRHVEMKYKHTHIYIYIYIIYVHIYIIYIYIYIIYIYMYRILPQSYILSISQGKSASFEFADLVGYGTERFVMIRWSGLGTQLLLSTHTRFNIMNLKQFESVEPICCLSLWYLESSFCQRNCSNCGAVLPSRPVRYLNRGK